MAKKTKPKGGRPPKPAGEAKAHFLQVRLQEGERDAFAEAADMAGVPLSTWVRERLRIVVREELKRYGKTPLFLDKK
jgi:hypothetical protein